jgi:hypothetical protein
MNRDDFKKEVLNAFPLSQIAFDSSENKFKEHIPKDLDPDLILFDDKNVYCVIKYSDLGFDELERDYYDIKEFDTWKPRDYEIKEYYLRCKEIYGKEIALCLINLFSKIRRIFTNFHMSDHKKYAEKDKLFHCLIAVSDNNFEVVKETLKTIQSKYNPPSDFDKLISLHRLGKDYLFSMNIAIFYHIIDPSWFGYKIKILDNKGNLIRM